MLRRYVCGRKYSFKQITYELVVIEMIYLHF